MMVGFVKKHRRIVQRGVMRIREAADTLSAFALSVGAPIGVIMAMVTPEDVVRPLRAQPMT